MPFVYKEGIEFMDDQFNLFALEQVIGMPKLERADGYAADLVTTPVIQ